MNFSPSGPGSGQPSSITLAAKLPSPAQIKKARDFLAKLAAKQTSQSKLKDKLHDKSLADDQKSFVSDQIDMWLFGNLDSNTMAVATLPPMWLRDP